MFVKSGRIIKFLVKVVSVSVIKFMKVDQGGSDCDCATPPIDVNKDGRKECPPKLTGLVWKEWPAPQKKARGDKVGVVVKFTKVGRLLRAHKELSELDRDRWDGRRQSLAAVPELVGKKLKMMARLE